MIKGGVESSVHADISLLVAIFNAMNNGDKLLQIINGAGCLTKIKPLTT